MSKPSGITLYYDEACTNPVEKIVGAWLIKFGRLDQGETKTASFYLLNQTGGRIEDLEITLHPTDKEGVTASLLSEAKKSTLEFGGKIPIYVKWEASDKVHAGRCQSTLTIKGMLTREE